MKYRSKAYIITLIRAYFRESLQLERRETNFRFIHKKFWRHLFLVISSIYVSTLPNAAGTTEQPTCWHHSFSTFHTFHQSFLRFSTVPVQNLQLQLHITHFTTANYILQRYANCHQLHVKICPDYNSEVSIKVCKMTWIPRLTISLTIVGLVWSFKRSTQLKSTRPTTF